MTLAELVAGEPAPMFTDPRQTSLQVHAHLRRLITTGVLPPGTELKQTELARLFGISRTPLREAFRMLQEEGLIVADVNQRGRVTGFDAGELSSLYASRISLECLATALTAGRLLTTEAAEAGQLLTDMHQAGQAGDVPSWTGDHRRFHAILGARAGVQVRRTVTSYAERSERYLRMYQLSQPLSLSARHREHRALLAAVCAEDGIAAARLMAQHLSRTALRVLADLAPDHDGRAIHTAVQIVRGGTPAGRIAHSA